MFTYYCITNHVVDISNDSGVSHDVLNMFDHIKMNFHIGQDCYQFCKPLNDRNYTKPMSVFI